MMFVAVVLKLSYVQYSLYMCVLIFQNHFPKYFYIYCLTINQKNILGENLDLIFINFKISYLADAIITF